MIYSTSCERNKYTTLVFDECKGQALVVTQYPLVSRVHVSDFPIVDRGTGLLRPKVKA